MGNNLSQKGRLGKHFIVKDMIKMVGLEMIELKRIILEDWI